MSALKEAFDRDHQRLELERQRLEEERDRAERLLRLEWLRQAGEREIARLRVLAARCAGGLARHVVSGGARDRQWTAGRVMLGFTWLFLLTALAAAFSAQSRVARGTRSYGRPLLLVRDHAVSGRNCRTVADRRRPGNNRRQSAVHVSAVSDTHLTPVYTVRRALSDSTTSIVYGLIFRVSDGCLTPWQKLHRGRASTRDRARL